MTIKMKILLLDNYDSFTYNLLHVVKELGATDVEVVRNDQIELDEVDRFDKIILSPGPGIPEEAGYRRSLRSTSGKSQRSISWRTNSGKHPSSGPAF